MRKVLLLLLTAGFVFALSGTALAKNDSPYDCDHGNSDKPCRPDPQPNHGKDCLHHGKNGGVNEDHCLPTTTTTQPPTTTTTAPPVTTTTNPPTTTTTAPVVVTTTQPPVTTTTAPPVVTTTTGSPSVTKGTQCTDANGNPFTTSLSVCPEVTTTTTIPPVTVAAPTPVTQLPHTGSPAQTESELAAVLILLGLGARKFATR